MTDTDLRDVIRALHGQRSKTIFTAAGLHHVPKILAYKNKAIFKTSGSADEF